MESSLQTFVATSVEEASIRATLAILWHIRITTVSGFAEGGLRQRRCQPGEKVTCGARSITSVQLDLAKDLGERSYWVALVEFKLRLQLLAMLFCIRSFFSRK